MVVRLSAFRTGPPFTPQEDRRVIVRLDGLILSTVNSNHYVGNRTHDLRACIIKQKRHRVLFAKFP
jgi:hypothetical protein